MIHHWKTDKEEWMCFSQTSSSGHDLQHFSMSPCSNKTLYLCPGLKPYTKTSPHIVSSMIHCHPVTALGATLKERVTSAGGHWEQNPLKSESCREEERAGIKTQNSPEEGVSLVSICRFGLFPHFLLQRANFPSKRVNQLQKKTKNRKNNTFN